MNAESGSGASRRPAPPRRASSRVAPPHRSAARTREHVLAVAGQAFYADGIHATGIDAIASRAGVATMTLYRVFASKDDLVAAYVEDSGKRYRALLELAAAPHARTPRERIL